MDRRFHRIYLVLHAPLQPTHCAGRPGADLELYHRGFPRSESHHVRRQPDDLSHQTHKPRSGHPDGRIYRPAASEKEVKDRGLMSRRCCTGAVATAPIIDAEQGSITA